MKKAIIYLLLLSAIFSCKQKTMGDKLQETVESNEKKYGNFEHYTVDSFRYSLGTLQDYYISLCQEQRDYILDEQKIREEARQIPFDSLIVTTSHDILLASSKTEYLTDLAGNPDPNIKVYTIDYYVDYQTDKDNFKGHKTVFLYADNLYEVHIDIDSLYKLWSKAIAANYDKDGEIKVLVTNDNMEVSKENLQDELALKIAGGTNEDVILDYRLKIATMDAKIAKSKADYWYLYD
jgi:hypothetical protein